jgi:hypothetical protein
MIIKAFVSRQKQSSASIAHGIVLFAIGVKLQTQITRKRSGRFAPMFVGKLLAASALLSRGIFGRAADEVMFSGRCGKVALLRRGSDVYCPTEAPRSPTAAPSTGAAAPFYRSVQSLTQPS